LRNISMLIRRKGCYVSPGWNWKNSVKV